MSACPRMRSSTTESSSIFVNPNPEGCLPPQCSPEVTKGPRRTRASIIFGPLISNEEGRRWFKDSFNYELASDHLEDMTVLFRLEELAQKKGMPIIGCYMAPRRLEHGVCDLIVITQVLDGPYTYDGPYGYEGVYQEDLKPIPGVREEEVKAQLEKEFGIHTIGFMGYFTNMY